MRTRDEHLAWAKHRALAYVDEGDLTQAMTSMLSDLSKHEETASHAGLKLFPLAVIYIREHDVREMRHWIEGFL